MSRLLTVLIALLIAGSITPNAAAARQVIGTEVNPNNYGIDTAEEARQTRFRYARVNPGALEHSRVALNLFGDTSFDAEGGWTEDQLGNRIWLGSVEGEALSTVLFARSPSGLLVGKVETPEATYVIQPKAGRIHSVVEVGPGDTGNESAGDDAVTLGAPVEDVFDSAGKTASGSVCEVSTSCANQTIDVMVVYTGAARSVLGGTDESAQAAIAAAVAEMNAANLNTGVTHSYNLVYSGYVDYAESGDANTDLSRLYSGSDGFLDEVHVWRDTYGADLVSLVTDTGGCGIGYVQSNPSSYNSNAAFSVVRNDCLTGNKTLAHEMGHNMGLHHDWHVNGSSTPCELSHGYVNQAAIGGTSSQRWRTIMAYNTQCSDNGFNCTRLTFWSNPLNLRDGDAMGIPQGQTNPSDAAFALNRAACQVAQFREATVVTDPPVAILRGAPAVGAAPFTVGLDATESFDPDGSIVSVAWSFGDGANGSGFSPSHTYTAPGQYTVTLTVTDDAGATSTATGQVHVTASGPVAYAVIGDWGDASNPAEGDVAALVQSWNPDFVITTGDNNYPLGEMATMDQNVGQFYSDFIYPYAGSYGSSATTNRFFPSLGNHDWESLSCPSGSTCTGPHFDYFDLPDGPGHERYYEFTWGDVHFFALDSDSREPDGRSATSQQAVWLQDRLAASTATWQVVYFHHPPYSSSSTHGSTAAMQWPFAAWGADAVLGGHDHTYERLTIDGIPYFVNGLGGRSRYGLGTPISGSEVLFNSDYGAMLVEADASSMTFRFVTRSGVTVDTYTIGSVAAPIAAFTASPVGGDAPLPVQFTDTSTGFPTAWSWDFGDGTAPSTDPNPQHVYADPGVYTVTLTASNDGGSDTATAVDYVTVTAPPVPPNAPSDLAATAVATGGIRLDWTDNASDEDGFRVERSDDGVSGWSLVVDVAANTVSWTDDGLAPGSTLFYRVAAYNADGTSPFSNTASATTPVPEFVDHFATNVVAASGTVTGPLSALSLADDGQVQTVDETETNGNPRRRTSEARVTWEIPVRVGYLATLYSDAVHTPTGDGDTFVMSYSDDGSTYTELGAVPSSSGVVAWSLGITAGPTVWIRIEDTDRTPGNQALDHVAVDLLYIRTQAAPTVDPPGVPTGVTATATGPYGIDVAWTPVSEATGYRIERAPSAAGPYEEIALVSASPTLYTDSGLEPATPYSYRLYAFNSGGASSASDVVTTTTDATTGPTAVHLGALAESVSGKKRWKVTVTVVIHDPGEAPVAGATVHGLWNGAGAASCVTDASGTCSMNSTFAQDVSDVTFDVTDATGAGLVYDAGSNDVGTSIFAAHPDLATKDGDGLLPEAVSLHQNYPNPFNPSTVIEFGLPESGPVTLAVFNVLGIEVSRLVDGETDAGWHRVTFDASGLSSGVYLAVLRVDGRSTSRVMLLAK